VRSASFAAPIGGRLRSSARFRRNQRVASGVGMIGLGACGIRRKVDSLHAGSASQTPPISAALSFIHVDHVRIQLGIYETGSGSPRSTKS
jgi:hypothetical protein